MFETVAKIIADKMDIDVADIKPESTFADLTIDSLDMVEITMDIEEAFSITLEKNEGMESVADLVAYIEQVKG